MRLKKTLQLDPDNLFDVKLHAKQAFQRDHSTLLKVALNSTQLEIVVFTPV
jgi:hypothetical protein